MKDALVHRAIAKIAERRASLVLILEPKGQTSGQGRLSGGITMTTPVIVLRCVEAEEAPFALGAAGGLAKQLRHAFPHAHSSSNRSAHATQAANAMVLRPHHGPNGHRNGFLPDLEIEETAQTSGIVML